MKSPLLPDKRAGRAALALLFAVVGAATAQVPGTLTINLTNGVPRVSATGVPGRTNRIEASTNVALTNWLVLSNGVFDSNGLFESVDNETGGVSQKFYRGVSAFFPPEATLSNVAGLEDQLLTITLEGSDPENLPGTLTALIQQVPAAGTLRQFDGPPITNAPETVSDSSRRVQFLGGTNAFGTNYATLQYQIVRNADGATSSVREVAITLANVNDAPVPALSNIFTLEDTPLMFQLAGGDPDGDSFVAYLTFPVINGRIYQVVQTESGPARGAEIFVSDPVLITDPERRVWYEPLANLNGFDVCAYQLADQHGAWSEERSVRIDIAAVNDPPRARLWFAGINNDLVPVLFTLNNIADVDNDIESVLVTVTRFPQKGKLFRNSGGMIGTQITPENPTFTGRRFWFRTESFGDAGLPGTTNLLVEDYEYFPNGTFSVTNFTMTVTNYYCDFDYVLNDGVSNSPAAMVIISVPLVNNPPLPLPPSPNPLAMPEDASLTFNLRARDADLNQTLRIIFVQLPTNGVLRSGGFPVQLGTEYGMVPESGDIRRASFTHHPNTNFFGTDSFGYRIQDSGGFTYPDTLVETITVQPVNDPPRISADSPIIGGRNFASGELRPAVLSGTGANFSISDVDPDLMRLIIQGTNVGNSVFVSGSAPFAAFHFADGGRHIIAEGTFQAISNFVQQLWLHIYAHPDTNINEGTLTIVADDLAGGIAARNIRVRFDEYDDGNDEFFECAKTASYAVDANSSLALMLTSKFHPDGAPQASVGWGPFRGTLSGTPPHLIYTPNPGYIGPDFLMFSVPDPLAPSGNSSAEIGLGVETPTALRFNGTNSYVVFNRSVSNDFTIECWFRSTQVAGGETHWWQGRGLVDAEVAGGIANDFGLTLGNGKLLFGIGNPDTTIRSGFVADGNWHHAVATRSAATGELKLYVDGLLVASGTSTNTLSLNTPAQMRIGSLQSGVNFFAGDIDDVRLWNVVRTQAEIQTNMNRTLTSKQPGLVTQFRFNEALGASAFDSSGRGFHGTLVNGPEWVQITRP